MSTRALFSLVFDNAKQRGARGDAGFAGWSRRVDALGSFGGAGLRRQIQSPETAIATLRRTPYSGRSLEALVVGQCLWDSHPDRGGDPRKRALYGQHLQKLLGPGSAGRVDAAAMRHDATQRALDANGATVVLTEQEVDAHGVTRVGGRGKRDGAVKDLPFYVNLADPRNWSKNFGSTFRKAYAVAAQPADPLGPDPPPLGFPEGEGPGNTWKNGLMFEDACLEISRDENLTQFRDILEIDFLVDEEERNLRLSYSLSQCLTSSVGGIRGRGGLDIDSGNGAITLTDRGIKTTALKCIRFTEAAAFSDELNLFAFPFLLLWIPSLILSSLQA